MPIEGINDPPHPQVVVESDYDGYFEYLVRGWMERKKGPFIHDTIVISAGPYRPYVVTYEIKGTAIHLDFYSAYRSGFGHLGKAEVAQLIELL